MIKLLTRNETVDSAARIKLEIENKVVKAFVYYKTYSPEGVESEKELTIEQDMSADENKLYILMTNGSELRMLDAFKHTHACREKLLFLKEMFNMNFLIIFKVGKKCEAANDMNLLVELRAVNRENFELVTTMNVEEEVLSTTNGFFPVDKRRDIFAAYSLTANGVEHKANDEGVFLTETDTTIMYDSEYIDLTIKKYDHYFKEEMNQADDDEKVYVESTCGLLNATMIKMENGVGTVRLYPFGYEGPFTIKIGWRWYRVRDQYDLILKKA